VRLSRARLHGRGHRLARVESFLTQWGRAVAERIVTDPNFDALPVPPLARGASFDARDWGRLPTIFPFLV
jgi:hypothetical protein